MYRAGKHNGGKNGNKHPIHQADDVAVMDGEKDKPERNRRNPELANLIRKAEEALEKEDEMRAAAQRKNPYNYWKVGDPVMAPLEKKGTWEWNPGFIEKVPTPTWVFFRIRWGATYSSKSEYSDMPVATMFRNEEGGWQDALTFGDESNRSEFLRANQL
jgi:hypothetical protein